MTYPNIQVSKGMAGWFAVMVWWNPDFGGFAEPYETGNGRYEMQEDAIVEAKNWAESAGIPFYPPKQLDNTPARQDVVQQIKEAIPGIIIVKV